MNRGDAAIFAELTQERDDWKEAAEQAEHELLIARARYAENLAFYMEWVGEEMTARRMTAIDLLSTDAARAVAECKLELLLESNRCLPDLDGVNAWQSVAGDSPIFEAVVKAVA